MDSAGAGQDIVSDGDGACPFVADPPKPANDSETFLFGAAQQAVLEQQPKRQQPRLATDSSRGREDGLQRRFDVALAVALIVVLLPLILACAIAVACSGRGPLLFRHRRIGRHGREFECLKFRTMESQAHGSLQTLLRSCLDSREQWGAVHKLKQDPRVTPVGRLLRRYSLDELPQLLNVLTGDMSIVGPRPIVAAEVSRYGARFSDYCSVKPGLTGLWQVSGRHSMSYDERVRLDAHYASSKSVGGDVLILLRTVPVVLFGQNE